MEAYPGEAFAVLVAGGTGQRMGSGLPKQFLLLSGLPILFHTLGRFCDSGLFRKIVVVLPHEQICLWEEICLQYSPGKHRTHSVVAGGKTRSESVFNGIKAIDSFHPDDIVAIHDGVRPFVNTPFLKRCLSETESFSNAVPCVIPPESFRYMDPGATPYGNSHSLDRTRIRSIQTPQCFFISEIRTAMEKVFSLGEEVLFTDEASLLEAEGRPVHLIPGLRQNIKITEPFDLQLAEFYFKQGY